MGNSCRTEPKPAQPMFCIYEKRSITDFIFFIFFIACWVAMFGILIAATKDGGNISRMVRGVDTMGRTCGKSVGVENKSWAIWPDITEGKIKFCSDSCDETRLNTRGLIDEPYDSIEFIYYCIPNISVPGDFESVENSSSRTMADLLTAWPVILASGFIALFFSFIYLKICEYFGGWLVWGLILILIAAGFLTGYAFLKQAAQIDSSYVKYRSRALKGVGWSLVGLTFIFTCVVYFLRDRIRIAIEVVKEASEAIEDMKSLPFFPIFPIFFALGYFVYWITTSIFIFSVSNPTNLDFPSGFYDNPRIAANWLIENPTKNHTRYIFNDNYKKAFTLHFFHMLWMSQFLVYLTFMIIAVSIGRWYFSRRDPATNRKIRGEEEGKLPYDPIREAVAIVFRFHIGTVALASLIIAIIQFIRAVVLYLEEVYRKIKNPNRLERCLFCIVNCCLGCVQCCMEKISKNSVVWTAVWGDAFIPATCSSFRLLWDNLARVAAINAVTTYLIYLGKVIIALATTGVAGILFLKINYYQQNLNSTVMPLVTIFIMGWIVAHLFMIMFETTIDTIFLCFLIDEQVNKGTENMFASKSLVEIVNKYHGDSVQKASLLQHRSPEPLNPPQGSSPDGNQNGGYQQQTTPQNQELRYA